MGHAPGELPDQLHLLRVEKLRFELFSVGEIADGADDFQVLPLAHGAQPNLDRKLAPILVHRDELAISAHGPRRRAPADVSSPMPDVTLTQSFRDEHFDVLAVELVSQVAEQAFGLGVGIANLAVGVRYDDRVRSVLDEASVFLPGCFIGLGVPDHDDDARSLVGRILVGQKLHVARLFACAVHVASESLLDRTQCLGKRQPIPLEARAQQAFCRLVHPDDLAGSVRSDDHVSLPGETEDALDHDEFLMIDLKPTLRKRPNYPK